MSAITEKKLVHAPLASANLFLQALFANHTVPNGEGARIVLRVGKAAQLVIVNLQPAHRPADMTPHYRVNWETESSGPFPIFNGELTIGADDDYNAFWLVLDGTYAPPGGVAGQLFDAVFGHRLAAASARSLLTDMRVEIDSLFAAQERVKTAH
jgi:hypothetical protein